ncbi:MAG: hypothetical protein HYZ03_08780 [candidate division NC10 bacterium]|nr:hypothetical protein [candidate division NC10 bacterium]
MLKRTPHFHRMLGHALTHGGHWNMRHHGVPQSVVTALRAHFDFASDEEAKAVLAEVLNLDPINND